jgi:hypothetical protein
MASIAALASALACYLRLSLWVERPVSIWLLEATIFLCGIVLWGFVFAWHTRYTHRPVFVLKLESGPFIAVTLIGIIAAVIFHLWLDPSLRLNVPEEYPADLNHWLAQLLFSMFLSQLFLLFAPFAWSMRLFQYRRAATIVTVLFSAFVWVIKNQSLPTPIPHPLFAVLLVVKIATGFLAVWFYLRGGIILIWWWTILFESRHLLNLAGNP